MKNKVSIFKILIIFLVLVALTLSLLILKNAISPFFWFLIIFCVSGVSMLYSKKVEKNFKNEFQKRKDYSKNREIEEKSRYI